MKPALILSIPTQKVCVVNIWSAEAVIWNRKPLTQPQNQSPNTDVVHPAERGVTNVGEIR